MRQPGCDATLAKVVEWVDRAAAEGCKLVAFGEALVPGYPFWVERTEGAKFESDLQKTLYAHYVSQAVTIEDGDLDSVCKAAARGSITIVMSVAGLMRKEDIGDEIPAADVLRVAELDHERVLDERYSLDVAGHYSRPDVTRLIVNRKRQTTAEFTDGD